jgi:hypothetical protein
MMLNKNYTFKIRCNKIGSVFSFFFIFETYFVIIFQWQHDMKFHLLKWKVIGLSVDGENVCFTNAISLCIIKLFIY